MKELQQAEALRLADALENGDCFDVGISGVAYGWKKNDPTSEAAEELRRQHARIAELEADLEAVGAGGVQSLRKQAAAPQAVHAAVPLPLLLRDIARDLGITVPEACNALKPLGNYSTNSAVTAEMARMLRDHFPAPAHPAYGVPEQDAELDIDDLIDRLLDAQQDLNLAANVHMDQSIASASTLLDEVEIALRTLSATHPTQQWLDAQRWQILHNRISGEYIAGRACFVVQIAPVPGASIMRGSVAEHFIRAVDFAAAQAKQGEQT